jgi:double-strand break repair protein MRE11
MPIFSIHGNHDDPVGDDNLSTLDQLASNNYINYFGRQNSIQNLKITPFLIKKGEIKLAIYGIGHMKDERLNLAFENQTIRFEKPLDQSGRCDESYFNILVLHQNKYKGYMVGASHRNSILDSRIPNWFNLCIWGHEHESIP